MKNKFKVLASYLHEAEKQTYLFQNLWKEKTTALIHGPREADKCGRAIEVANAVTAKGRLVMYVTTDSSLETHVDRFRKPSNIIIFKPEFESPDDRRDYADIVIEGIEEAVKERLTETFIVDSVTRIAALSFGRNSSPAYVMKRLVALQMRLGISLLVIAHDASAATTRALVNLAESEIPMPQPRQPQKTDTRPEDELHHSRLREKAAQYTAPPISNHQTIHSHPS